MLQRAIVVGASSGIGAALTRRLCAEGWSVCALARREEALRGLTAQINAKGEVLAHWVTHDVLDRDDVERAFDAAVRQLEGVDAVIYAAGIMPAVDRDGYDTALDAAIVGVNLTGAMAWCNLAAERFAEQGAGTIVGIGSVAGERGRVGNPAYCASKAGLHSYLESLRNRLDRLGVRVVTIKPGPVDTPMVEGRGSLPLLIGADVAAEAIAASLHEGPQVRYLPWAWAPIMAAVRAVPSVLFRRLEV